jgi:hypothetical protein
MGWMQFGPGLPTPGRGLTFAPIGGGANSRLRGPALLEVNSPNDLANRWSQITGAPGSSAPKGIDWTKEQVVFIISPERPTGGHSIFVVGADVVSAGQARLRVMQESPPPGAMVTQATTYPWAAIRIEKKSMRYRYEFVERPRFGGEFRPWPQAASCPCRCVECTCPRG